MVSKPSANDIASIKAACLSRILADLIVTDFPITMVDMGTGAGTLALLFRSKFPQAKIIGIDKKVAHVRQLIQDGVIEGITVLEEDIRATSLDSDSVEAVFFYNMVKHMARPALLDAFKESRRVLKNDGRIIVIDLYPKPRNAAQRLLLQAYEIENEIDVLLGEAPELFRQPEEVAGDLARCGFQIERTRVYEQEVITLPISAWDSLCEGLLKSSQGLSREIAADFRERTKKLGEQVQVDGLQTSPFYAVVARSAKPAAANSA